MFLCMFFILHSFVFKRIFCLVSLLFSALSVVLLFSYCQTHPYEQLYPAYSQFFQKQPNFQTTFKRNRNTKENTIWYSKVDKLIELKWLWIENVLRLCVSRCFFTKCNFQIQSNNSGTNKNLIFYPKKPFFSISFN